nr:DUF2540 domain-containing protein [Methanococcus maripaludis]
MDAKAVRYYFHKLENLNDEIDLDILIKAITTNKPFKRPLTLTEEEEGIINRYGRATNTLTNYMILKESKTHV